MDEAPKRSVPTLVHGSPEGPGHDDAPTIRREPTSYPARSMATPAPEATRSRPPGGARRTIRGSAPSTRPPVTKPTRGPSQPPSVVVADDVEEPVTLPPPEPPAPPAYAPPAYAPPAYAQPAYALPPLPPPRHRTTEEAPARDRSAARRGTSSGVVLGSLLALALVVVTLGVALAFTRRSTPTHAIAPTVATPNVSLLYDGGAPRGR